jgi:hypothetical protein
VEAYIRRVGKRKIVVRDGRAELLRRTERAFVVHIQGTMTYGKIPVSIELHIEPTELGEMLDKWGVTDLIRGTTRGL